MQTPVVLGTTACRNGPPATLVRSWRSARRSRTYPLDAEVTQGELAPAPQLREPHREGDRRLDVPEFIQWCEVPSTDPVEVMRRIVRR